MLVFEEPIVLGRNVVVGDSWEELSIYSVVGKKENAAEVVSRG